jgi:L-cystine uptake protein TcyP (sodium:dicarboxylate symporter family)
MESGIRLTHLLVVVLFILIYLIKTTLLLLNKQETLMKFSKMVKVPEMIVSILFLVTGIYMLTQVPEIKSLLIIKIVAVFAIMGKDFMNPETIVIALGLTVILSTVEGGIPNGGYIAEIMIMTVYNFPVEMLPVVMIIGTLVDPMATLLNATGDTVSAMLVSRFSEGKDWLKNAI